MEPIPRLTTFLRQVMSALAATKTERCTIWNRWDPKIKFQGLQSLQCYSGSAIHPERKRLKKICRKPQRQRQKERR